MGNVTATVRITRHDKLPGRNQRFSPPWPNMPRADAPADRTVATAAIRERPAAPHIATRAQRKIVRTEFTTLAIVRLGLANNRTSIKVPDLAASRYASGNNMKRSNGNAEREANYCGNLTYCQSATTHQSTGHFDRRSNDRPRHGKH